MSVLLKKNTNCTPRDINEEIHQRLRNGSSASFIYVVPTKRKVRDLQREFLRIVPGGIAPAFHLFTFETLAAQLFTLLCPPKRVVSGAVQAVMMSEAILSVERSLRHFRIQGRRRNLPQGTFQKIINVINELKEHGVYSSVLYDEIQTAEIGEQAKLQDILAIYEAYENILADRYIDAAGMLKEVNARWSPETSGEKFSAYFNDCDTIFISGFDEFSDPELTMLYHLSNIKNLGIIVSFDYHLENDEVFGHLKENYHKLLEMGFQKIPAGEEESTTVQRYIARHLFQHHTAKKLDCTDRMMLAHTDDREQEVEMIAKIIKRLVSEQPDRDLSKICVSMYYPQTYTNIFREVFARYGIPSNITDRYSLNQSSLVVAILALLAVQERNFRLTDIMRALSSSYFDFSFEGKAIDAGNLYNVASLLKISAGVKQWIQRIDQRLHVITMGLRQANDDLDERRLRREEVMMTKARMDITVLVSVLEKFQQPLTPPEFKEELFRMMDRLRVVDRLLIGAVNNDEQLERDTRAYQSFAAFIDEFLEILLFEGKATARERISFYLERLRTTIAHVRYNVKQKYGYGVYVTSFDETRGLNFDVMIIAGMVDGEFPPVYLPEIFFSPHRRERKERYHLREQRYLFYQALTNFSEHVFLTFPRYDGERELVPSSFLASLQNIVTLNDQRDTLAAQLMETLYSEDELLQAAGRAMGGSDETVPVLDERAGSSPQLRATFDHMRHSIHVERSRIEGKNLPEYNGIMTHHSGTETKTALERLRNHVYSVTQLESYGRCPFQFFADRVLRLNVVETAEEGLTPLERGGLLHEILFEFYTQRREQGLSSLQDAADEQFDEATTMLLAIARKKLDELQMTDIFWDIDKEMILGSSHRKGVLLEFLKYERERKVETAPAYFELAFGPNVASQKSRDALLVHEEPIRAGDVQLRGKIDRVDLGNGLFTVIDYKSGTTVARRREINLGMSLQLPLYLYAVEYMFKEHGRGQQVGAAGVYYSLRSPVKEQLGIGSSQYLGKAFHASKSNAQLTSTDEELRSVILRAVAFVNDYVDNIAKGNFPVKPRMPEHVCTTCDFTSACRIQVRQTAPPADHT